MGANIEVRVRKLGPEPVELDRELTIRIPAAKWLALQEAVSGWTVRGGVSGDLVAALKQAMREG